MTAEPFLQPRGGYRKLRVYKTTEIVYDITFYFTSRYLKKSDRTIDQMVQAARSGKQNIAEGSKASMTSTETELKLTNVAKASLEELLIDYEDYLRVRNMEQWGMDHPRMVRLRNNPGHLPAQADAGAAAGDVCGARGRARADEPCAHRQPARHSREVRLSRTRSDRVGELLSGQRNSANESIMKRGIFVSLSCSLYPSREKRSPFLSGFSFRKRVRDFPRTLVEAFTSMGYTSSPD